MKVISYLRAALSFQAKTMEEASTVSDHRLSFLHSMLKSSKKTLQGITKVRCRTGLRKVMELKYLKMEISTKVNGIRI